MVHLLFSRCYLGGYFINEGVWSNERFTLPELNLPHNSGQLQFDFKFFGSDESNSELYIYCCSVLRSWYFPSHQAGWRTEDVIELYCNGQEIQVSKIKGSLTHLQVYTAESRH